MRFLNKKHGVVSLGAIILLGAVIVEIALTVSVLSLVLNNSNYGARLSAQALAAAQSGIEDSLLRVVRHDYPSNQYPPFPGGGTPAADVIICEGTIGGSLASCGTTAAAGKTEIISVGNALTKKRELVAVVEIDPVTRLIKIESMKEIPL